MDTKTMIRGVKYVAEKHKNDTKFTGQTVITDMCNDIIPKLEKLSAYETAEEEGRLYILPHGVNVGDCVHAICRFMRDKASTIGINRIMCSEIPMIGRIVSPSHEEIKKVLEKMPKSDSNSESQQLEIKVCRYEKEKT